MFHVELWSTSNGRKMKTTDLIAALADANDLFMKKRGKPMEIFDLEFSDDDRDGNWHYEITQERDALRAERDKLAEMACCRYRDIKQRERGKYGSTGR